MEYQTIQLDFSPNQENAAPMALDFIPVRNDSGNYEFIVTPEAVTLTEWETSRVRYSAYGGMVTAEADCLINDDNTILVPLLNSIIGLSDTICAEVSLYKEDSRVTSRQFKFRIRKDIDTSAGIAADDRYPVLDELITRTEGLNAEAKEDADRSEAAMNAAVQAENSVAMMKQAVTADKAIVDSKTEIVLEKAGEVQTNADATAKNTDKAATASGQAQQALSDLLAMLGTDIATLVGGKIPVEQIPSIATTEIYTAGSVEEMNALEVQTGDICIRTDENKSYIYKDTNWVYLASPTDYASRAGHADTAATAENAAMINNHRMVEMTAEEFAAAVKDPDTYYLVH